MRIPIRWKLILLLGTLTLVPLLLLAWIEIGTLGRLGSKLASETGQALSDQVRTSLERQADDFAARTAVERRSIEMVVHLQAREITRVLREPALPNSAVFWTDEATPIEGVPDAKKLPTQYFQQSTADRRVPLPVTFSRLSLYQSPGTRHELLVLTGQKLGESILFFKTLRPYYHKLVYWHFSALENGLFASYPGHAGYPIRFEPRDQGWYVTQRERSGLTWSRPRVDVTSRLTVVSATLPLHDAKGAFIGVTGVDVPISQILRKVRLPDYLASAGKVLLTTLSPLSDASSRIEIITHQNSPRRAGDWQENNRVENFSADSPSDTAKILADMQAGQNGSRRINFGGLDTFCVYRRFDALSAYLVVLVPTAMASQTAANGARYALQVTHRQIDALVPLTLIVASIAVLAALVGARAVTGPIQKLMVAVRAVARGDFSVRVHIHSGDELEQLGRYFNQMVPTIAAHAQMRQALAVAREIQQHLLPASPPLTTGLDIHAICCYAEETGGDYFDYLGDITTPDAVGSSGRVGIAIGDVSGHGVGSALLMSTARAFLHAHDFETGDLTSELRKLNENLVGDVHAGRFMTLYLMVFDVTNSTVEWVAAGHDAALYFEHSTQNFIELAGNDIPLGIDRHWAFNRPGQRFYAKDDVFVLATDGIWEARATDGSRFGKTRLRACITAHATANAATISSAIMDAVTQFRGDQAAQDDMTVVTIKITSPESATS